MDSTFIEQPQQESEAQSIVLPDPVTTNGSSFEVEHPLDQPHQSTGRDNNVPRGYPKPKTPTQFRTHTLGIMTKLMPRCMQANHVSQRLVEADMNASKITEFVLSLEGQVTNWYSQHDLAEF